MGRPGLGRARHAAGGRGQAGPADVIADLRRVGFEDWQIRADLKSRGYKTALISHLLSAGASSSSAGGPPVAQASAAGDAPSSGSRREIGDEAGDDAGASAGDAASSGLPSAVGGCGGLPVSSGATSSSAGGSPIAEASAAGDAPSSGLRRGIGDEAEDDAGASAGDAARSGPPRAVGDRGGPPEPGAEAFPVVLGHAADASMPPPTIGASILVLREEPLENILMGVKTLEIRCMPLKAGWRYLGFRHIVWARALFGPPRLIQTDQEWIGLVDEHLWYCAARPYTRTYALPVLEVRCLGPVRYQYQRGQIGMATFLPCAGSVIPAASAPGGVAPTAPVGRRPAAAEEDGSDEDDAADQMDEECPREGNTSETDKEDASKGTRSSEETEKHVDADADAANKKQKTDAEAAEK
jgi:hypothetical protein